MADFILPIEPKVPLASFEMELTGSIFNFEFQYNKREDSWYMNILNADTQEEIIMGTKIVVRQSLMEAFRDLSKRPLGHFVAINSRDENADPLFDDLGENVKLLYSEF